MKDICGKGREDLTILRESPSQLLDFTHDRESALTLPLKVNDTGVAMDEDYSQTTPGLFNRVQPAAHTLNIIRDEHATNAAATFSARSGRC